MREQAAALLAAGRFHEAMALHADWLRGEPASVPARIGLARACIGAGDVLVATAWLSDAVRLAPDDPEPLQLLADLLLARKEVAQALSPYLQLLERFGQRSAANLLHAGFCQEQAGAVQQAAACYREAIGVDPGLVEAHIDLAGVLWRLEDFDGALLHARHAVRLAPQNPFAQRILGTALMHLNRLAEAEGQLRHALQLQPGLQTAQLDLAFTLLLGGRLEEGWALYQRRWDDPRVQRPDFWQPAHEWPGPSVPLAGQAIAVYAEQGRGDVLQFLRYLPLLQQLGAEVGCVVPPDLVPLVEASFPGVRCLAPGRELRVQWHVALMDLPQRLGTTLATVPAAVPYLRVPEHAERAWDERMQPWRAAMKIGLAWAGSPVQVNNRNRSMPLGALLPLLERPGTQWFSLQKDDAPEWTDLPRLPPQLVDLTGDWREFGDSAAQVAQLDLVITVDSAIAHLAGALGKPVWILLAPNADWRWLLQREDSPWYPTARLFRRDFGEDRAAQVERVRQALSAPTPALPQRGKEQDSPAVPRRGRGQEPDEAND